MKQVCSTCDKAQIAAYKKAYYEEKKEHIRAQQKAYYYANRERILKAKRNAGTPCETKG
jgi:hypothetical protein